MKVLVVEVMFEVVMWLEEECCLGSGKTVEEGKSSSVWRISSLGDKKKLKKLCYEWFNNKQLVGLFLKFKGLVKDVREFLNVLNRVQPICVLYSLPMLEEIVAGKNFIVVIIIIVCCLLCTGP